MEIIEIEVINWEKYNPRTDRKKSSWFRLENGIAAEPKFFGLTASQKFVAICLFAEASKKCGAAAAINVLWLADQLKIEAIEIHKTIQHLVDAGVVKVSAGVVVVSSGCPTNVRTNDTNVRNERLPLQPAVPAATTKELRTAIWNKYSDAYFSRYGTEPVRNAAVNSKIKSLAERLGDEAKDVVEFYVSHNNAFYVRATHPIGLCLQDAEGLRTQWATGRMVSQKEAANADSSTALASQLKKIREGSI